MGSQDRLHTLLLNRLTLLCIQDLEDFQNGITTTRPYLGEPHLSVLKENYVPIVATYNGVNSLVHFASRAQDKLSSITAQLHGVVSDDDDVLMLEDRLCADGFTWPGCKSLWQVALNMEDIAAACDKKGLIMLARTCNLSRKNAALRGKKGMTKAQRDEARKVRKCAAFVQGSLTTAHCTRGTV